jgi:formiminoglutamase
MKLPYLVSLPHAGLEVPEELKEYCILNHDDIVKDGDEEAYEIYSELEKIVEAFQTTTIARAFVDMNRPKDDIRLDGVVKTHTIWDQPIYNQEIPIPLINKLIDKYWKPYHENLSRLSRSHIKLGIDCHTMAATGPPIGPDTGKKRPLVCLSNANKTCPDDWIKRMAECFENMLNYEVKINDPFTGGYIIREHSTEIQGWSGITGHRDK